MWDAFLRHLSVCGRDATIFFVGMAGMFGIGAAANALEGRVSPFILVPILGTGLLWAMYALGRRRTWDKLGKLPPLQREDLRRARSKLLTNNLRYGEKCHTHPRKTGPKTGSYTRQAAPALENQNVIRP